MCVSQNTSLDNPASTTTATAWDLDATHSVAEFSVKHLVIATVKGTMAVKQGAIELDPAAPENARIVAELDASTIDTRTNDRDAHLRSADFLDVENHPTLRFESTRIEALGDDRYRIHGTLAIRGKTLPVVLDAELEGYATDPWGGRRAVATATTTLDRREWGLTWNQALETGGVLVGDKVKVTLHVQAVQRKA